MSKEDDELFEKAAALAWSKHPEQARWQYGYFCGFCNGWTVALLLWLTVETIPRWR